MDLRANTAVDVLIGPFVDDSDGNTTEEALTIEDEHVLLSKNGQGLTAKTEATDAVHDDLGYYNCPLDTIDTNTEGNLVICIHMSGALPVRHEFNVLSEAAWDSLYIAKDAGFMDVNIKTIGRVDDTETEATNLEAACAAYSVTRGLAGTALPAAAADASGGIPISDAGGLDLDDFKTALIPISTVIASDDRSTTTCRLTVGSDNNDAYVGMRIVIDDDAGDDEYVSRTITAYVGATKLVTFTPALTEAAEDGGKVWILPGDTKINVTADAIEAAVITNAAGADIAADIIAMKAETVLIVEDTNELQTDWKDGGRLDLIQDIIAVDVAGLDGDGMLTAAAVNAQVVDALATDTYAEHAGVPAATCSLEEKITWLFMLARNKMTQTAATATLRNDADGADVATSTVSDNAVTATRGEWT